MKLSNVVLTLSAVICIQNHLGTAFECYNANGTDAEFTKMTKQECKAGVKMCFKFQCNARGCGGYNDSRSSIPNFECKEGWRFCDNCTEQLCNDATTVQNPIKLWLPFCAGLAIFAAFNNLLLQIR